MIQPIVKKLLEKVIYGFGFGFGIGLSVKCLDYNKKHTGFIND